MTRLVRGISGTLLPDRYVAHHLLTDVGRGRPAATDTGWPRRWWTDVSARLGPTAPLRRLFDDVAMPLFGWLNFTAHDVTFSERVCRARLATGDGSAVALLITPWASRPSSRWADLARQASAIGATWGFVLSPPFLSIVPALGSTARESVDLRLPDLVDADVRFLTAVAHASRFDVAGPGRLTLNDIVHAAAAYRDLVRTDLQQGVDVSMKALSAAIKSSRGLPRLARGRRGGARWSTADAGDEALTVVFRILFLLFAESRRLVPNDTPIYARGYTLEQLCRDAIAGTPAGQWESLAATSRLLRLGCRTSHLRVEPFNGALFARRAAPTLEETRRPGRIARSDTRDTALRQALVALGSRSTHRGLEVIDYRDLGVEQLGAVYERVLDVEPRAPITGGALRRRSRHSRRRRESGTFYTPEPLAAFLVRRTLAPLVDGRTSDEILRLRVLDPAMGSGAFLVAACRYLAASLEQALIDEGRLSPDELDDDERARLRRQVAERCLAGVDRNGTAVQLARLSLWLTTLARDRPLGFLDHHLRTGNSLVGAWPDDLSRVEPSGRARLGTAVLPLFELAGIGHAVQAAVGPARSLFAQPDDAAAIVHAKAQAWRAFQSSSSPLHRWRCAADVWCARWFVDGSTAPPDAAETRALVAAFVAGDRTLPVDHVRRRTAEALRRSKDVGFFHWPLEFPDDFYTTEGDARSDAGFDAVIGNPPWEMVRRDDGGARRDGAHLVPYVRNSGQYPSCTSGHLNLYQPFVDRALTLARPGGRIGLVVPWGLSTDDGAAAIRRRLIENTAVDTIVGLDNAAGLFPIHRGVRMAILTATTGRHTERLRVIPAVRHAAQLATLPERGVGHVNARELAPADLRTWTGPMLRVPDLRREGDLELLKALFDRHPRLGAPNGWGISFGRELNATSVRAALQPSSASGVLVIEGKHLAPFRVETRDARRLGPSSIPPSVAGRIGRARVGYRDVAAVGNRFTMIAAIVPAGVATTHTVFVVREDLPPARRHFLCACLNSYVVNAIVRMFMGGHVTTSLAGHLPIPRWRGDAGDRRIAALARCLAGRRRRDRVHHQLQALMARRFGLSRTEFAQVLEGFPHLPVAERHAILGWFDRKERG